MVQLSADFIPRLRGVLSVLCVEMARFQTGQGDSPAEGSKAARERTGFQRPESLVSAWSAAAQLIESGQDHMTAFVKTITEPMDPIACWTCVRSLLESCALASWLLDPGIDARARAARVFARRFDGLQQQLKYARAAALDQAKVTVVAKRIDEVERIAIQMGYPRVKDSNGRRIGIAQKMPSATELIRLMLDDEAMYRLLSAVAHGHSWAIIQLGFEPVAEDSGGLDAGGVPVRQFQRALDVNRIAYLGVGAARALAIPVWHQCCYFGWDRERLSPALDSVFDALGAAEAIRFWKIPSK